MILAIIKEDDIVKTKISKPFTNIQVRGEVKFVEWSELLCDFLNQKSMTKKETITYLKNYLTLI